MPYAIDHPSFAAPVGNPRIWRYVDLAKYVSMLVEGGLFFARSDLLGDPFEGSLPLVTAKQMDGFAAGTSDPERTRRQFAEAHETLRRYAAVCCWHMNESESYAMWKSYADAGIAIVSDFQHLASSFRDVTQNVFVGVITYRDFDDPNALHALGGNSFNFLMSKRDVFASEAELRAVITRFPEGKVIDPAVNSIEGGILVQLDLNKLIIEVRVSPTAEPWRLDMIRDVTERYGLKVPVEQSAMAGAPRW